MTAPLVAKSVYIGTALEPKTLKSFAKEALKGVQFDTVVGSGLSGILPLNVIADTMKCYAMAIRKKNDDSHAGWNLCEGTLGHKWIFVDDFAATGETLTRIWEAVDRKCKDKEHEHECVGAFLYDNLPINKFQTWDQLMVNYPRLKSAVEAAR